MAEIGNEFASDASHESQPEISSSSETASSQPSKEVEKANESELSDGGEKSKPESDKKEGAEASAESETGNEATNDLNGRELENNTNESLDHSGETPDNVQNDQGDMDAQPLEHHDDSEKLNSADAEGKERGENDEELKEAKDGVGEHSSEWKDGVADAEEQEKPLESSDTDRFAEQRESKPKQEDFKDQDDAPLSDGIEDTDKGEKEAEPLKRQEEARDSDDQSKEDENELQANEATEQQPEQNSVRTETERETPEEMSEQKPEQQAEQDDEAAPEQKKREDETKNAEAVAEDNDVKVTETDEADPKQMENEEQSHDSDDSAEEKDARVEQSDRDAETSNTAERVEEEADKDDVSLRYGEGEEKPFDPALSDAENVQDDIDFAKQQMDEYQKAVENGEIERDPEIEKQLQDSLEYAQQHADEIADGQAYSYDTPGEYWSSPEGREIAGEVFGKVADKAVSDIGSQFDFPGDQTVSDAATNLGQFFGEHVGHKAIGKTADVSKDLMERAYDSNATPGDRFNKDHFLRDEQGRQMTAAEGREAAFAKQEVQAPDGVAADPLKDDDGRMTPEQVDAVKDRIYADRQTRAEHPSGYGSFDRGEAPSLTAEPAKLSSKNFDRLAQERGYTPQQAEDLKYSMNEFQKPDVSLKNAPYHPNKGEGNHATVRHVLEPEKVYNYNNGQILDGREHSASGNFVTPDKQVKAGRTESEAAQENLALPSYNDATFRNDTTLHPKLDNGKQHNVIEGTAAPQNGKDANDIFKSNDGIDRHGGGRQILTDGGFESGGVTEARPDQIAGRRIPGEPGVVTGGDSQKLGRNMLAEMGVPQNLKWGASGYQAHHIIPKEMSNHPVIQKIGMNMDDASNGIFLRKPNDGVNTKSIHYGNHGEYTKAVKNFLDSLDPNESVEALDGKVADLQESLRASLEDGVPIYKSKDNPTGSATYREKGGGATQEMWTDAIQDNMKNK